MRHPAIPPSPPPVVPIVGCLLLAAALASCGGDVPARDGPDASPTSPTRIVSLHPSATATLVELGAADRIVGVAVGDDPRVMEQGAEVVGTVFDPDAEAIVRLRPDLVVAWDEARIQALDRLLPEARIVRLRLERWDDLPPLVDSLGAWLGLPDAARTLRERLDAVEAPPAGSGSPRVLWVASRQPISLAGRETFIDDLLGRAGAVNAVSATGWPAPSRERLLRLDPDVVVWPRAPGLGDPETALAELPWSALDAVREGRVLVLDPERFQLPTPDAPDAVRWLADTLSTFLPTSR